jgi:hypothetical protein
MSKENPMLQTEPRTFADMAVAQDWELEQGNEGALIWADLGPELARVVCENPEILAELAVLLSMGEVLSTEAWAGARKGAWTEVRIGTQVSFVAWAWLGMWYGTSLCPGARAWVKDRYL